MIVGVGTDIVDISRIASLHVKYGDRFLSRIFTSAEATYCVGRHNTPQHLAARFAAKEAAMKALGTGFASGIRFTDIEVCRDQGSPRVLLYKRALELSENLGVSRIHLSISHDKLYAVALILLEGDE